MNPADLLLYYSLMELKLFLKQCVTYLSNTTATSPFPCSARG